MWPGNEQAASAYSHHRLVHAHGSQKLKGHVGKSYMHIIKKYLKTKKPIVPMKANLIHKYVFI